MTGVIGAMYSTSVLNWPVAGSSFSCPTKSTCRRSPSQKAGIEIPPIARKRIMPSSALPGRLAATTPSTMPTTTAISMAAKSSSRVAGSRVASSSSTGRFVASESPQSPVTSPPR